MEKEETTFSYSDKHILHKKFIPSQVINTSDTESVVVEYDGISIQAIRDKKSSSILQIIIDGQIKAEIEKDEKSEFVVLGKSANHILKIWNAKAKFFLFSNFIKRDGISLLIDDIPVKNTLADPLFILKEGRISIWAFFTVVSLKLILSYTLNDIDGFDEDSSISTLIFYGLPAVILLLSGLLFNTRPIGALYIGIIIGSLETIDFISGVVINEKFSFWILFFLSLRISFIFAMIRSIKALKSFSKLEPVFRKESRDSQISDDKIPSTESGYSVAENRERIEQPFSPNKSLKRLLRIAELKFFFTRVFGFTKIILGIAILSGIIFLVYHFGSEWINKNRAQDLFNEAEKFYWDSTFTSGEEMRSVVISKLNQALEYDENFIPALFARVRTFVFLGDYSKALLDIEKIDGKNLHSEIDTGFYANAAETYFNLAYNSTDSYTRNSHYEECKFYAERYIELREGDTSRIDFVKTIKRKLALTYNNLGEYDDMLRITSKYVSQYPTDSNGYWLRAMCKLSKGDYYGAISDANKSISYNASFSEGYLILGTAIAKKIIKFDYKRVSMEESHWIPRYSYGYEIGGDYKYSYRYSKHIKELNEALFNLKKSIELYSSNRRHSYYWMGITLIALQREIEGCEALSKAGELGYNEAYDTIKENCNK